MHKLVITISPALGCQVLLELYQEFEICFNIVPILRKKIKFPDAFKNGAVFGFIIQLRTYL